MIVVMTKMMSRRFVTSFVKLFEQKTQLMYNLNILDPNPKWEKNHVFQKYPSNNQFYKDSDRSLILSTFYALSFIIWGLPPNIHGSVGN